MLVVFIRYKGYVVYVCSFKNHKKAIDHFVEMYENLFNGAVLGLTKETEIPLGPSKKIEPFLV